MCPINKARRLLFIVEQICIDVCFHDIVQGYYWFQRLDLEKNKISWTMLLITAQSNVQYPIFTPFIHWQNQWERSQSNIYLIHTHIHNPMIKLKCWFHAPHFLMRILFDFQRGLLWSYGASQELFNVCVFCLTYKLFIINIWNNLNWKILLCTTL